MTATVRDNAISERLRDWIKNHYPQRGKFTQLQKDSQIPAQRWKDLYYGRQYATAEMTEFLKSISTSDAIWVLSGVYPPKQESYPFLTAPPTDHESENLTMRLIWVIKEWTSPRGADLFNYLGEKFDQRISPQQWADVILGKSEPTVEMVELVCRERAHLAVWIVGGSTCCATNQVDPTNEESIKSWQEDSLSLLENLTKEIKKKKTNER